MDSTATTLPIIDKIAMQDGPQLALDKILLLIKDVTEAEI